MYLYITVNVADFWMVKNVYWYGQADGFNVLNGILSVIMLSLRLIIVIASVIMWKELWKHPRFEKVTVK